MTGEASSTELVVSPELIRISLRLPSDVEVASARYDPERRAVLLRLTSDDREFPGPLVMGHLKVVQETPEADGRIVFERFEALP